MAARPDQGDLGAVELRVERPEDGHLSLPGRVHHGRTSSSVSSCSYARAVRSIANSRSARARPSCRASPKAGHLPRQEAVAIAQRLRIPHRHPETLLAILDGVGHWDTVRGNDRHFRGHCLWFIFVFPAPNVDGRVRLFPARAYVTNELT
jgi:hypothetical protein